MTRVGGILVGFIQLVECVIGDFANRGKYVAVVVLNDELLVFRDMKF